MKHVYVITLLACLVSQASYGADFTTDHNHLTSRAQEEFLDQGGLGATEAGPARELSKYALEMIKDFEQWRPRPYNDASSFCTIGYGHLVAKKTCAESSGLLSAFSIPLSIESGNIILDDDSKIARYAVQRLVVPPLNDEQFGALASFVFNVGPDNFKGSTLLKYLNNSEFEGADAEFSKWIKAKGQIVPGLITRRNCEALLFSGKLDVSDKFDRQNCGALGAAPTTEDLIDIETGE